MQAPITCWNKMRGYNKIEEIVRSMEIVNDCAERGIKLITDFKDVTKNEQQTQYLLQVIEDHQSHTKSLLKKICAKFECFFSYVNKICEYSSNNNLIYFFGVSKTIPIKLIFGVCVLKMFIYNH
jgi:hypothetical protein